MKLNQSKDTEITGKALTIIRGFKKLQMTITCLLRMCLIHAVFVENYFSKAQRRPWLGYNQCIKIIYYWAVGR